MDSKLDSTEKAILKVLNRGTPVSIDELLKTLPEHPESEIRGALWALLAAGEAEITPEYLLQPHPAFAN